MRVMVCATRIVATRKEPKRPKIDPRKDFTYTGQPITDIPRDVTHLRVDPAVVEIPPSAFRECKKLTEVNLPEGLERISEKAFGWCKSLRHVKIPSTVTSLGDLSFNKCENLIHVELSDGLTQIGRRAFWHCQRLESITIPSTVKEVKKEAFARCGKLVNLELAEGLETIAKNAFFRCESLKRIRIPSTVKTLCHDTFAECVELVEIELCEGLKKLGGFQNCISLRRIKVPSTVVEIQFRAFCNCALLVQVELQEGLRQIDTHAFEACSSLEHIRIPSTVTEIEPNTFRDCDSLRAVVFANEEIEEFGNGELLRELWNNGTSGHALVIFNFSHLYMFPERLGKLHAQKWVSDIYSRMKLFTCFDDMGWYDSGVCDEHFKSIDSKLTVYETLEDISSLLELALWKCKNYQRGQKKEVHRYSCGANVIIPNVLSFLLVEKMTYRNRNKMFGPVVI